MSLRLEVKDVVKRFGRSPVFQPVSFQALGGDITAIVGSNGSGKSTLLKILAGILSPSRGTAEWFDNAQKLDPESIAQRIGFVAPYLELYNELSATEHLHFVAKLKGVEEVNAVEPLTRFGLNESIAAGSRLVGQYSSGMRQRVALGMAAIVPPDIVLLDEPSSNLDEEGITLLFSYILALQAKGAIVILATNDMRERDLANKIVHLQAS